MKHGKVLGMVGYIALIGVQGAYASTAGTMQQIDASALTTIQSITTWIMGLSIPASAMLIGIASVAHSFQHEDSDANRLRLWRRRILVSTGFVFGASALVNLVTQAMGHS